MGRAALEAAIRETPEIRDCIAAAERDLRRLIALLEPHARSGKIPDPDLAFQVKILQQALQEITWMLRPGDA